jgi:hypothetical protein
VTYTRFVLAGVAVTLIALAVVPAAALRDGQRFDPAATMTGRAERAPEQLDKVAWMVGHWAVDYTRHVTADSSYTATGRADVTFMNRGHGLLERFHCPDFDGAGDELNTLTFLVYNPTLATWGMGMADSWRENVTLYNGDFEGEMLVLENAIRRKGNLTLTRYRLEVRRENDDAFAVRITASTDGESYASAVTAAYTRMPEDDGLFSTADGFGEAAPGLPEQARQFDFLIGEWDLQHEMHFPDGRTAKWPAYGTAAYMLDGHCVMEYTSNDADPRVPDAATTIVRLWNRQMRRWECMYTNNRFYGILHFGGVKEGDRIVLHTFGSDASDTPVNQWVFHDWTPDGYGWFGNTSRDRGQTWKKTWIIEGTRRK